ncbi:C6 and C2H2 transcription factor RegA-like [Penicillium mononematosum]|uniref:C6 and C2H2 transcription factor RegA-like n=1 Tax=Penicillium mononematosum TaxID=268346 RepID=UPI00254929D9|nr:C6 and C2H2 transcription factor RegA-like [Penicillium mononematosum]KAJ6186791.1 C6 and C2H2 transcription factor RegA-like [Penicillium mononematosum]
MDGDSDCTALRRFTLSGQGTPAISSPNGHVPAAMRLFHQLLHSRSRGGASDQQTRALDNAFSVLEKANSANTGGQRKRRRPGS